MATVYLSEDEVRRDFHAVLDRVQEGAEIVIEREDHTTAVLTKSARRGRPISEAIALPEQIGSETILDGHFAQDVLDGINERELWNPPPWD